MKIKIYGSRGSVPFFSKNSINYGGNTSCVRLDIDGHFVLFDCGTGALQFSMDMQGVKPLKCDILLSHLHLDHIVGMSAFSQVFEEGNEIRIFTKSRCGSPLASQVFGVFKPPYWPVDYTRLCKAELLEIDCDKPFYLYKNIKVTPFKAEHPDDTLAFRIDADKSFVYLLDYEADEKTQSYEALVEFCKGADAAVFDAAYLPEDYPSKRGWGHSTYKAGIALAEKSGCKKMIFAHLAQEYTDEMLDICAQNITSSRYCLAFDGMELEL